MNRPQERILWIDIARGIGIVLVVYGHVLRGVNEAGMLSTANPVWSSDYAIYTFHMPLFFLLAGLQVKRSLRKGAWPFLKSKLLTIAYPYLLWALVQGSLQLLVPGLANGGRSPWSLATLLWHPIAQFWFLYMLFLCHLAGLVTRAQRNIVIAVTCLCAVFCFFHPYSTGLFDAFPHWFFFYGLGILVAPWLLNWRPTIPVTACWMAISAFVFAFGEHFGRALSHDHPDAPFSWIAGISGIVLVISVSQLIEAFKAPLMRYAVSLGQASMTVYIFHVMVAAGVRVCLKRAHITEWLPQLIAGTLLGVFLPWMLHVGLDRCNLLAPLGLGTKKRPVAIPC